MLLMWLGQAGFLDTGRVELFDFKCWQFTTIPDVLRLLCAYAQGHKCPADQQGSKHQADSLRCEQQKRRRVAWSKSRSYSRLMGSTAQQAQIQYWQQLLKQQQQLV
jgi:hypothetical protein